jgi:hypothetical protein
MGCDAVQHTSQTYQHFGEPCYLHLQDRRVSLYPEDGNQQIIPNIRRPFYQTTLRHSPKTILFNMQLTCHSSKLHSHSKLVHTSNLCSRCVWFEHRSGQKQS